MIDQTDPGARSDALAGVSRAAGAAGLVTSAITRRVTPDPAADCPEGASALAPLLASSAWSPSFPTPAELSIAAAEFAGRVTPWDGRSEGKRARIVIAPGAVQLAVTDPGRAHARSEYLSDKWVDSWAGLDASTYGLDFDGSALVDSADPHFLGERGGEPGAQIEGWSRRSRSRMIHRLAELDYSPLVADGALPAMITLTYPGDWLTVAPTGAAVKKHLDQLRKRFERAWGAPLACVWKLEFQRRGAPHVHMLMVPPAGLAGSVRAADHALKLAAWESARSAGDPAPGPRPRYRSACADGARFGVWLSENWADIVDHPDAEERRKHVAAGTGIDYAQGTKSLDPKRLAVYFSKHGTFAAKDYQHNVPAEWQEPGNGPGRFWGYWQLEPLRVVQELTHDEYQLIARTLRKRAQRARVWDTSTGSYRWVKAMQRKTVIRQRTRILDTEPTERGSRVVAAEVLGTRTRSVRVPVRRFTRSSGYVCVNDGPSVALALARVLPLRSDAPAPTPRQARLTALLDELRVKNA